MIHMKNITFYVPVVKKTLSLWITVSWQFWIDKNWKYSTDRRADKDYYTHDRHADSLVALKWLTQITQSAAETGHF